MLLRAQTGRPEIKKASVSRIGSVDAAAQKQQAASGGALVGLWRSQERNRPDTATAATDRTQAAGRRASDERSAGLQRKP